MKRKYLIISTMCLLLSSGINAQVTIGSATPPAKGALLDLKEFDDAEARGGGRTASKGIMMPRVILSKADDLSDIQGADMSNKAGYIGLLVYNTVASGSFCPGLHVWIGSEWVQVAEGECFMLNASTQHIDIPSGYDSRAIASNISPVLTWAPASLSPTWSTTATGIGSGAVLFATPPTPVSPITQPSPATLNLDPSPLSYAEISANPFATRESMLKVSADNGSATKDVDIKLNQTNYAIQANKSIHSSVITIDKSMTSETFDVKSNVAWAALIEDVHGVIDLSQSTLPNTGGSIENTGIASADVKTFNITVNNLNNRSKVATITFKDARAMAKDITVTISQCGYLDGTDVTYVTDAPANATEWGTQTWRHTDQSGKYFLSGDFGDAGRWMTSNLDATSFDATRTSTDTTVPTSMTGNTSVVYGNPYYYSNSDMSTMPGIGKLYNWAGATNKKGGADGENTFWNEDGNNTLARIQGICPAGWHLPTDWEWTELENEILQYTSRYSSTPDIDPSGSNLNEQVSGETANRNTKSDAAPWKDACIANGGNRSGTSNSGSAGGFAGLYAGYVSTGSVSDKGYRTLYWSSSAYANRYAWARSMHIATSLVTKTQTARSVYYSVRCKKD